MTGQSFKSTHSARCLRCGRTLRAAASISAGFGPVCRSRIRAAAVTAALAEFTAAQVEKARELIADAGIVPTGHAGVWRTVSSDGTAYYLSAVSACNCPGGLHGRRCYHSAAATLIAATGKAA